MKRSIVALRSSDDVKKPQRSTLRARIENQSSIWLSQEASFGGEMKTDAVLGIAQEGFTAGPRFCCATLRVRIPYEVAPLV